MDLNNQRTPTFSDNAHRIFSSQYLIDDETPLDALSRASNAFADDASMGQRLYHASSNRHFTFATPLLSNGGTNRGYPISCFVNDIDDSINGLTANFQENALLSTAGGGIGTYWGRVRALGELTSKGVDTPGILPFMHVQDAQVLAYHQGSTRRGAMATFLDISHPEIGDFIRMRRSTGGDVHRKNENLHHGVCIPDVFMEAVKANADWKLIDPHSGRVHEVIRARTIWEELLRLRVEKGEPFIFFADTANEALPAPMKKAGLRINHTNLCTEIMLPTTPNRTAVCCLSSLNLATVHEWWNDREQLIEDLVRMLDNALGQFIDDAPDGMWRARNSAIDERSIGLGALGFQTYLQDNAVPMDGPEARRINDELFSEIKRCAVMASKKLAQERGEAPAMKGTGMRHAHLLAVAPNASSSLIANASPSIEPYPSNVFAQKTKAGVLEVTNPALVRRLDALGLNTQEVWDQIIKDEGSVQNVEQLSTHDKRVFACANELDQFALVHLAADRQREICQGQSINLFLKAPTAKILNKLHITAWERGLKSLYYLRSQSAGSTNTGNTTDPTLTQEPEVPEVCQLGSDCVSCEG